MNLKEAMNTVGARLPLLATILICLGLVSMMFYTPLMNQCFCAALILFAISGQWRVVWDSVVTKKILMSNLCILILFTLGIFYSLANWHDALRVWDRYLKLSYLLFFIPLFYQDKQRNLALLCCIGGIVINELCTYLHYFNLVSFGIPSGKHWLFVQDIDSSFIVSFIAYLMANYALDDKKFRWLYVGISVLCTVDVLILNQERTGYLIYLALAALFLFQRLNRRGLFLALMIIPLTFAQLYFTSHRFNDRVNQVFSNVADYHQGKEDTSIGLRLAFAKYSFKVIQNHWLWGVGTGSFQPVYKSLNGPKLGGVGWPTHPHNEYIDMLFQLGIVGLFAFCYWLSCLVQAALQLSLREKFLLQGLILSFALLSFCNASLSVNPAGDFFVILSAIFLAANPEKTCEQLEVQPVNKPAEFLGEPS